MEDCEVVAGGVRPSSDGPESVSRCFYQVELLPCRACISECDVPCLQRPSYRSGAGILLLSKEVRTDPGFATLARETGLDLVRSIAESAAGSATIRSCVLNPSLIPGNLKEEASALPSARTGRLVPGVASGSTTIRSCVMNPSLIPENLEEGASVLPST